MTGSVREWRDDRHHGCRCRLRAYFEFVAAVCYYFVVRSIAHHAAQGLAGPEWAPLVDQAMLVFLLLVGYAAFGAWVDRQSRPIAAQGLTRRPGWTREAALGISAGWAIAVVCILPMLLRGGIAIVLDLRATAWGWLLADTAFFILLALGEEIAFRGYGFQRFVDSVGSIGAAIGYAAFYAIMQAMLPGANRVTIAESIVLSFVLSTAYLRTRALWVSWGINFGWKASRALVFGLAVSGVNSHSPVVQGDPMGPFWLTGGGFGLDNTWIAFFVLLIAWPVVYRAHARTRLPLQRARTRSRRHPRRSGCCRPRTARGRHGHCRARGTGARSDSTRCDRTGCAPGNLVHRATLGFPLSFVALRGNLTPGPSVSKTSMTHS